MYNIRHHIINTHTSAASSLCISAFSGISLSNFAIHDSQSLCNMVLKMKATTFVVQTTLKTMVDRAFSSLAPKLWNALPSKIRNAESFSVFKSSLKDNFF